MVGAHHQWKLIAYRRCKYYDSKRIWVSFCGVGVFFFFTSDRDFDRSKTIRTVRTVQQLLWCGK